MPIYGSIVRRQGRRLSMEDIYSDLKLLRYVEESKTRMKPLGIDSYFTLLRSAHHFELRICNCVQHIFYCCSGAVWLRPRKWMERMTRLCSQYSPVIFRATYDSPGHDLSSDVHHIQELVNISRIFILPCFEHSVYLTISKPYLNNQQINQQVEMG